MESPIDYSALEQISTDCSAQLRTPNSRPPTFRKWVPFCFGGEGEAGVVPLAAAVDVQDCAACIVVRIVEKLPSPPT